MPDGFVSRRAEKGGTASSFPELPKCLRLSQKQVLETSHSIDLTSVFAILRSFSFSGLFFHQCVLACCSEFVLSRSQPFQCPDFIVEVICSLLGAHTFKAAVVGIPDAVNVSISWAGTAG
jgi:hypothetical protein